MGVPSILFFFSMFLELYPTDLKETPYELDVHRGNFIEGLFSSQTYKG